MLRVRVFILFISLTIFSYSRDKQAEIDSLKKALNGATEEEKARIYNNLAKLYIPSAPNTIIEYSNKALVIARKNKTDVSTARAYNNLGIANAILSNYELAKIYMDSALTIWTAKKDSLEMASIYDNMGNVMIYQGDFTGALKVKMSALRIKEKKSSKEILINSYINLGILYDYAGLRRESIQYFERGLKMAKEINDEGLIAASYSNLASSYIGLKEFDKALEYLNEDYKIQMKTGDPQGLATAYSHYSNIYRNLKQFDKAEEFGRKAIAFSEKVGDKEALANEYSNLGKLLSDKGKHREAIEFLKKGYELSNEIGAKMRVYEASNGLATAYELTGDMGQALKYYKIYSTVKDSVLNEDSRKQITELQKRYESDKKDKEIALLNKDKELKENELARSKSEADKQRAVRNGFVVGFILVLGIAIIAYRAFRSKQEANKIISMQKKEVEKQKNLIEEKQREILDSIHYAKRIQSTLMAHTEFLNEYLPDNFVFFKPKDIVSGDFYWAAFHNNKFYLAVCDSTGHGVPGAFMCLLNIGFLSEAIKEKDISQPGEVLNYVRNRLIESISKDGQKDGFDGVLLCFDRTAGNVTFAGANNNPVMVARGILSELKYDKMPVGMGEHTGSFITHILEANKGDTIYLATDGYADQFGGSTGKKFKYKKLNELLLAIHDLPMDEQGKQLNNSFEEWRGDLEQVDDVCIIGIRL